MSCSSPLSNVGIRPSTLKRHLADLRARSGLTPEQLIYRRSSPSTCLCCDRGHLERLRDLTGPGSDLVPRDDGRPALRGGQSGLFVHMNELSPRSARRSGHAIARPQREHRAPQTPTSAEPSARNCFVEGSSNGPTASDRKAPCSHRQLTVAPDVVEGDCRADTESQPQGDGHDRSCADRQRHSLHARRRLHPDPHEPPGVTRLSAGRSRRSSSARRALAATSTSALRMMRTKTSARGWR